MRDAVLLAGGLGSRLSSVSGGVPKSLIKVGGRPFINYVLDQIIGAGCERVIIAASYKWLLLKETIGSEYRSCRIEWSIEDEPLGTGGGIYRAYKNFGLNRAYVLNSDTFFKINFKKLAEFHSRSRASITIALKSVSEISRFGGVQVLKNGRVINFYEKSMTGPGAINGGIYIIEASAFDSIVDLNFSFEKVILQESTQEKNIFGMNFPGYFIDIGVPEDLRRAELELPFMV